ncbi:hypothetical protein HMN09_00463200 [Mycena chlorophos]|uniref:Uncharacterized protein n=1 Tax=Mycena chlorophos TaxID=658473 RepID=A0A8H6WFZ0_MYCCL|nr:hypothetical protein HMN09_00463200 [Mycena chlorophos]
MHLVVNTTNGLRVTDSTLYRKSTPAPFPSATDTVLYITTHAPVPAPSRPRYETKSTSVETADRVLGRRVAGSAASGKTSTTTNLSSTLTKQPLVSAKHGDPPRRPATLTTIRSEPRPEKNDCQGHLSDKQQIPPEHTHLSLPSLPRSAIATTLRRTPRQHRLEGHDRDTQLTKYQPNESAAKPSQRGSRRKMGTYAETARSTRVA